MDLRCRVDQLIDSNCHLELNSMNAGIVIMPVDSALSRLFVILFYFIHTMTLYNLPECSTIIYKSYFVGYTYYDSTDHPL